MRDVWILGAGFSKAINDVMPAMGQLVDDLEARDGDLSARIAPFERDIEAYLSYLASDQPWLPDIQNLLNRAAFRQVSDMMASIISLREEMSIAMLPQPPAWLNQLIHLWRASAADVITFNYDTLVERGAAWAGLIHTSIELYAAPLGVRSDTFFGSPEPAGKPFALLKMHGSTNWGYGGLDAPPTDRIWVVPRPDRWDVNDASQPWPPSPAHDDLVPFIVPPTASKSLFYGNRSIRAQWRRAANQLSIADRIFIVGYSLPLTDRATRDFLATSVGATVEVIVCNPNDAVVERVASVLPDRELRYVATAQDLVNEYAGDVVEWGVRSDAEGDYVGISVNGELLDVPEPSASSDLQAIDDFAAARWPDAERLYVPAPYTGDWTSFGGRRYAPR